MANRRGKVESVTDFIFLGSKITADSDCSQEITRHLILGRKTMTNVDPYSQTMVFPVVMYGCESWGTKKVGHQRTDACKCGAREHS